MSRKLPAYITEKTVKQGVKQTNLYYLMSQLLPARRDLCLLQNSRNRSYTPSRLLFLDYLLQTTTTTTQETFISCITKNQNKFNLTTHKRVLITTHKFLVNKEQMFPVKCKCSLCYGFDWTIFLTSMVFVVCHDLF